MGFGGWWMQEKWAGALGNPFGADRVRGGKGANGCCRALSLGVLRLRAARFAQDDAFWEGEVRRPGLKPRVLGGCVPRAKPASTPISDGRPESETCERVRNQIVVNPLHALVRLFVDTFGITQPSPEAEDKAGRAILIMLLLVLAALVMSGFVVYSVLCHAT